MKYIYVGENSDMQMDFHYYATYCAAFLAGYTHEESLDIAYSAQFVDDCSRTLLAKIRGPMSAATTQLQLELMDARTDPVGLQDITRIWSSFHFLPKDLYAERKRCSRFYRDKYRLICGPNGDLVVKTVENAKDKPLQAVGIAMHVLADTWAHANFAGTPSMMMNDTNYHFYEYIQKNGEWTRRKVQFGLGSGENLEFGKYINTISTKTEKSIMSLGHGQAGHLPDYSCMRYVYMPSWGRYEEIFKDNPSDYWHAFCQMIYAMKYLHGEVETFELNHYDFEAAAPYEDEIKAIFEKRQLDDSADWKALGEKISGCEIEDFSTEKYVTEYTDASSETKNDTFIGQYFQAAMAHKIMVTEKIIASGNTLAGKSLDYVKKGRRIRIRFRLPGRRSDNENT